MDSPHQPNERRQVLGYLLGPPVLFLAGCGLATVVAWFVDTPDSPWLNPLVWGSFLTIMYLTERFVPGDKIDRAFAPPPPSSPSVAKVRAVSTSLYVVLALAILVWTVRGTLPDWVLAVVVAVSGIAAVGKTLNDLRGAHKPPSE